MRSSAWIGVALALAALGCSDDSGPGGANGAAGAGGAAAGGAPGGGAGGAGGQTALGGGGAGGEGTGGSFDAFVAAAESDGFVVQEGRFTFLDLSACCALGWCFGNNPTSPYGGYALPRAPGQTAPNAGEDEAGLSTTWRLGADEAIVLIGRTPPRSAYFGLTSYLFDRDDGQGGRKTIFGSLGDTLNQDVLARDDDGDGAFGATTVVIHAADAGVTARARAALEQAGYPAAAANLQTLPDTYVRFGLGAADDTLSVLFRLALPEDEAAAQAYRDAPPWRVLRLSPAAPPTLDPLPVPALRPRGTGDTEEALAPAVAALREAILAAHPGLVAVELDTTANDLADWECVSEEKSCNGDNRDTVYPVTDPFVLPPGPEQSVVVYGVNHAATGKATYANFALYGLAQAVGVVAVASPDMPGSAAVYLPGHSDADKLYAYRLMRSCPASDSYCVEVPGGCPGVDDFALALIAFRAYVEPSTQVGPLSSELLLDRAIRFHP